MLNADLICGYNYPLFGAKLEIVIAIIGFGDRYMLPAMPTVLQEMAETIKDSQVNVGNWERRKGEVNKVKYKKCRLCISYVHFYISVTGQQ